MSSDSTTKSLQFNMSFDIQGLVDMSGTGTFPEKQWIVTTFSYTDNFDARIFPDDAMIDDVFISDYRNRYLYKGPTGPTGSPIGYVFQSHPWSDQSSTDYNTLTTGNGFLFRETPNCKLMQFGREQLNMPEQIVHYLAQKAHYQIDEILCDTSNFAINILGSTGTTGPVQGQTGGITGDRDPAMNGDEWANRETGERWIYQAGSWQLVTPYTRIEGSDGDVINLETGITGQILVTPPGTSGLYIWDQSAGETGEWVPFTGSTGAVGATGAQGPQGHTGVTGADGAQGIDGATGAQGPQGPQGHTGVTGADGAQGIDGATGAQGPQGHTGVTGADGAQGVDGTTGAQGPQGHTGTTGADGAQGIDGATGAQGPQGHTGVTGADGAQGVDGTTGAQGPQGHTGVTGADGAQGVDGATGAQGPQGHTGTTGADGAQGIDGATGAQGPQGHTGTTGADGAQGIDGTTGAQGPQGHTGVTGADGAQGIDGTTGAQGPQGHTGTTGADGAQGIDGATGAQGPQGHTGVTGADGAQGIDGTTGAQGPQGHTGTTGADGAQGIDGATGAQGPQGHTGVTGADGAQGIDGTTGAQGPQGLQGVTGSDATAPVSVITESGPGVFTHDGNPPSGPDTVWDQPYTFGTENTSSTTIKPANNAANTFTPGLVNSTIAGGNTNAVSGDYSLLGAGQSNFVSGSYSIIGAGSSNTASALFSIVGAGSSNTAGGSNSGVLAGNDNMIASGASDSVIVGGDSNDIRSSTVEAFIGAGDTNDVSGNRSAIVAGQNNTIQSGANNSGIFVGTSNEISSNAVRSVVVNGMGNTVNGSASSGAIIGADNATVSHDRSVVLGGDGYSSNAANSVNLGGTLYIDSVNLDQTPTKMLVWDSSSDEVKYKEELQVKGDTGMCNILEVREDGNITYLNVRGKKFVDCTGAELSVAGGTGTTGIKVATYDLTGYIDNFNSGVYISGDAGCSYWIVETGLAEIPSGGFSGVTGDTNYFDPTRQTVLTNLCGDPDVTTGKYTNGYELALVLTAVDGSHSWGFNAMSNTLSTVIKNGYVYKDLAFTAVGASGPTGTPVAISPTFSGEGCDIVQTTTPALVDSSGKFIAPLSSNQVSWLEVGSNTATDDWRTWLQAVNDGTIPQWQWGNNVVGLINGGTGVTGTTGILLTALSVSPLGDGDYSDNRGGINSDITFGPVNVTSATDIVDILNMFETFPANGETGGLFGNTWTYDPVDNTIKTIDSNNPGKHNRYSLIRNSNGNASSLTGFGGTPIPGNKGFSTNSNIAACPTFRLPEAEVVDFWRTQAGSALPDGTDDVTETIFHGSDIAVGVDGNIDIGRGGGNIITNTRVGDGALAANTTGINNVAIGPSALAANTEGESNIAIGIDALSSCIDGFDNIAIGKNTLQSTTSSNDNIAIGSNTLADCTTGSDNVAIGNIALNILTTGTNNVAIGSNALENVDDGSNNTAVGSHSLNTVGYGEQNVAVGTFALENAEDSNNTAVGYNAMNAVTSANECTAVGHNAMAIGTGGTKGVAIGASSLENNTGSQNTAVGTFSMKSNTNGFNNVAVGYNALTANTTGDNNVAIGQKALENAITSGSNTAVGDVALRNCTSSGNTAVGTQALTVSTTGSSNVAVGFKALAANLLGSNNVAVGSLALDSNTNGFYNTGIGYSALSSNTTASDNTAVGYNALLNNQTGSQNVAVGNLALEDNTTSNNVAIGYNAGLNVTTCDKSVFIGSRCALGNLTGNDNIVIGYEAMLNAAGTADSNIMIGSGTGKAMTTGSENVMIGHGQTFELSTTANRCTGVGHRVLPNLTGTGTLNNSGFGNRSMQDCISGSNNTAMGADSLGALTTGLNNTAIGGDAGTFVNGNNNVMLGVNAMRNNSVNTASQCVANGFEALYNNEGNDNVAVGYRAAINNETGTKNTCVGAFSYGNGITGINCTMLGYNADTMSGSTGPNLTNSTAIGYNATVLENATMQLGDTNLNKVNTSANIYANGMLLTSDERSKTGITGLPEMTRNCLCTDVKPRLYKDKKSGEERFGVVAQEIPEHLKPYLTSRVETVDDDTTLTNFAQNFTDLGVTGVTGTVQEIELWVKHSTNILTDLEKLEQSNARAVAQYGETDENIDIAIAELKGSTGYTGALNIAAKNWAPTMFDNFLAVDYARLGAMTALSHSGITGGNPHNVSASDVGNDTAQWNADKVQDVTISGTAPTAGQVLTATSSSAAEWSSPGAQTIEYDESENESSTTGTSWMTKLAHTFTASASDYLVQWNAEVSATEGLVDAKVKVRVQQDDTTVLNECDWTPAGGFSSVSGFKKVTLTAGSHTFDIDYASSVVGKSVTIRKARIMATKLT